MYDSTHLINKCNLPLVNVERNHISHAPNFMQISNNKQFDKLRIGRYYDHSFYKLTNYIVIQENIIEPAIKYWEQALRAKKPRQKTLKVSRACPLGRVRMSYNGEQIEVCKLLCNSTNYCDFYKYPSDFVDNCVYVTKDGKVLTSGKSGRGIEDVDILIFVTSFDINCPDSTKGYGITCQLSMENDSPAIGILNICPGKIGFHLDQFTSVDFFKHQMAHILAINPTLYAFFRYPNNNPMTPRDLNGDPIQTEVIDGKRIFWPSGNTIRKEKLVMQFSENVVFNQTFYVLCSKRIKEMVKSYFKCPNVQGIYLENNGTVANQLAHFEKRIFQSELMTAELEVSGQLSTLSLTVMEASGWYEVYYKMADYFMTGYGAGCIYLTWSCYEFIQYKMSRRENVQPYCKELKNYLSCSGDWLSVLYCNLEKSTTSKIPYYYRYFQDKELISDNELGDYCPALRTLLFIDSDGSYVNTGECTDISNVYITKSNKNYWAQNFGSNSRCISAPLDYQWKIYSVFINMTLSLMGAGCYEVKCYTPEVVVIVVLTQEYICDNEGDILNITVTYLGITHIGKLICPSYDDVCKPTSPTPPRTSPKSTISTIPISYPTKSTRPSHLSEYSLMTIITIVLVSLCALILVFGSIASICIYNMWWEFGV